MINCEKRMPSERELPFLLLLIAGVMEFLFISMESLFSYIGYYLVEDYIIVPCLLFVGIAMTRKLTPFAKKRLCLSVIAIGWFVVVQIIHKLSGMGTHPIGTVFFVYLMAFPFASVTEDREKRGLDLIGWMLIAAAMVQVFYTALLVFDCVPAFMEPFVYWDGARLHVFWHSNITACFLMVGIGFSFAMLFRTEKRGMRILLAVMIVLQFVAMALTNCRTTLLMTGAFFGSIAFFLISKKGGWLRFVIGVLVVLIVTVACFMTSSKIYETHNAAITNRIAEQLAEGVDQSEIETDFFIHEGTGYIEIVSNNGQYTLSHDMKTLNGRTNIWKAALRAVRDDRALMLWGTEYSGVVISAYFGGSLDHGHNSWMEALLRLGVPGLLIALVFTCISVYSAWVLIWDRNAEIWKKIISVMTMCVMVAGFLEPYLFITNVYYHVTDFIFFFCSGYLDLWRKQLKEENR